MLAALLIAAAVQLPPGVSRSEPVNNATVMCARLTYAPGAAESMHTHPFAAIVVQLTPGDVDMTIGDDHTRAHRDAGFVWYIPREVPHALVNAGTTPIEQVTIAIKPDRPAASAGATAAATLATTGITRTTLVDNEDTRVARVEFAPHGRERIHTHPTDLVIVQLTPGRVETILGQSIDTRIDQAGTVRFLPRGVRHAYASADTKPFTILSVMIK